MQQVPSTDLTSGAPDTIEQRAKIFAALADPTRLRIVELLANRGELSGSEIANHIGISLALFCHHSRTLLEAGVIQVRKDGQTKYNSLNLGMLAECFSSFKGLPNLCSNSLAASPLPNDIASNDIAG